MKLNYFMVRFNKKNVINFKLLQIKLLKEFKFKNVLHQHRAHFVPETGIILP